MVCSGGSPAGDWIGDHLRRMALQARPVVVRWFSQDLELLEGPESDTGEWHPGMWRCTGWGGRWREVQNGVRFLRWGCWTAVPSPGRWSCPGGGQRLGADMGVRGLGLLFGPGRGCIETGPVVQRPETGGVTCAGWDLVPS